MPGSSRYALLTVVQTLTPASTTPWQAPANLYGGKARCQIWGSTSGSGGCSAVSSSTGGGSGGAGYSEEPALAITAGGSYAFVLPSGGAAGAGVVNAGGGNPGDTSFPGDAVTVTAHPGLPGFCSSTNGARGTGGPASGNTIAFAGGDGAPGVGSGHGGGGGGSAGSAGAGGTSGGSSGGSAGSPDGAAGANGATAVNTAGNPGSTPGAGAGGARGGGSVRTGAKGGDGKIVLTYQVLVPLGGGAVSGQPALRRGGSQRNTGAPFVAVGPPTPPVFYAPTTAQRGAKQLRPGGHASNRGAKWMPPPPPHVAPFRPPGPIRGRALLRRGSSAGSKGTPVTPFPVQAVNQWTGTITHSPAWGNSLPGLASCVVDLTPANSTGLGSGTPTAGNWLFVICGWNAAAGPATVSVGCDSSQWWRPAAPSDSSGMTRTTIWYQPNILPWLTSVYVAPSAYMDGLAVTVIEVPLGPWDQVTTLASNYAAGATSLPLSAGAPGAAAFMLAAVTGDSTTAGTALTPGGWTTLSTVTASNGVDHSSDTVLAAASITTASAQSITGTASSAENISGMILSVLQHAPSPVPGGINPNWPYLVFEAAFGSGYGTPPDQMVWTNLQTAGNGYRLRDWSEHTGIQYELGALESTEGQLVLDNPDGFLSPGNPGSPWFPNVQPGTPVRIRAVTPAASRWYVIARNVERWPQQWDPALRGVSNTVITDQWSVINKELPTCYRAEVLGDTPGWWWPCDDPAVNNPTTLINAAPASQKPLTIATAPGGLASTVTVGLGTGTVFEFSAVQAFAGDSGWMYGDSDAASWAQTGTGTVSTGRYLQAQDTFPPLATGVTIEAWRNYTWLQTAPPNANIQFGPQGQPTGELYIWDATTGGPGGTSLAHLSLDSSGHLKLTAGSTVVTVYSGSDLRNATWFGVTVTLTQTRYEVWLNGGIVAHTSGACTISSSAWDTFTINATSDGTAGIGNPQVSHNAIYPVVLPAARVIAHFTAAYTAFGQLQPPAGLTQQFIPNQSYAPDGINHSGSFFQPPSSFVGTNATLAAYVTAAAGSGGESAVNIPESWDWCQSVGSGAGSAGNYAWLAASGPAAPTYNWYTGSGSGGEKLAATTVAAALYVDSYGTGAAPPATASPAGDTVQNRIERILQAGQVTTPARCVDAASAAVVASLDTGGQASGAALGAIQSSDSGLLFMNNAGNLCYFGRPRLAAMSPRWALGPDIAGGQIPYQFAGGDDAGLDTDPQQVKNNIQVTQFDVTGTQSAGAAAGSAETAGALVFAPDSSRYAAVKASQLQNGPCEAKTTSYLQDKTLIQAQANWLFDEFGVPRQRITNLTVRAEAMSGICPAAWLFVLGANVGDVFTAAFSPPGQPSFQGAWRISKIASRRINFEDGEASISIIGDVQPGSYWGV